MNLYRKKSKYKYLNLIDCPRECFYTSEKLQPEGWIIRQEYPHCYRYFRNLLEFEKWHESVSENQRTFYEVIRAVTATKNKIDIDGELSKLASYLELNMQKLNPKDTPKFMKASKARSDWL